MQSIPRFLVVDDVAENRFLLSKTLLRKFPNAVIQECQDSTTAAAVARKEALTAIVVHRGADIDGLALITLLRQANPDVFIIMVSGRSEFPEAIGAGANTFLNYDEWLRIGTVVEDLVAARRRMPLQSRPPFPPKATYSQ